MLTTTQSGPGGAPNFEGSKRFALGLSGGLGRAFCALACGAFLACQSGSGTPIGLAPTQADGASHSLLTDGGLAVDRFGVESGDLQLVFLHGWCENRVFWRPLVSSLQDAGTLGAGVQYFCLDLPGHGGSHAPTSESTPRTMGAEVAIWLEAQGLRNVILIGHNYGATVALEAAHEAQATGVVNGVVVLHALYDPSQPYEGEMLNKFAEALEEDFTINMRDFSQSLLASTKDTESGRWISAQMIRSRPDDTVPLLRALGGFDLRPTLQALRVPVRAVNGDVRATNVEAVGALVGDFAVQTLESPASGIWSMVQEPESCAQAVAVAIGQIRGTAVARKGVMDGQAEGIRSNAIPSSPVE